MKNTLTFLILLITVLNSQLLNGQCATVYLSTQYDVDNFTCGSSAGTIIIDDGGFGYITSLNPIYFSGLTEVTGDLVINNCPSLTSLLGLDAIVSIGGQFNVSNTDITSVSIAAYPLQLESAGTINFNNNNKLINSIAQFPELTTVDNIYFENNDQLEGVADFYNIGTIDRLNIKNNAAMTGLAGFTSTSVVDIAIELEDCPLLSLIPTFNTLQNAFYISIDNIGITALENFGNVQTFGVLTVANNAELTSISAFNSTLGCTGGDFPYALGINYNPSLSDITGFSSMQVLTNTNAPTALQVTNNPELEDCCWILPLAEISSGTIIQNNTSTCNSINDIGGQAPSIDCISDFTVSVDPTACTSNVVFTTPIAEDDCDDIEGYVITGNLANGLTIFDTGISPGEDFGFNLPIGLNIIEYRAEDGNGLIGICTTTVTVVEDISPTWVGGGNSATITGICGVDNLGALYDANVPIAIDNCTTPTVIETTTLNTICGASTNNVFIFEATDEAGNVSAPYTLTINLEDNTGPQISNVPADLTISCSDNFPSIPTLNAIDVCDGDVSDNFLLSETITPGDCSLGSFAEIREYTWSFSDGCDNISLANWSVTTMNDFSFDLGEDIIECNSNSYIINPGNIGSSYLWSDGSTNQSLNVTGSGTYTLTVTTDSGCCHSDEIDVILGFSPDVTATGNIIDCSGSAVTISGNSNTFGVSYSWTGPGGFTSNLQNPSVTELGSYTLTVSTVNMCTSTATATVVADVDVPDVIATGGTIDCLNSTVQLMGTSSVSGVTYAWTGPNGFTSVLQDPEVIIDGIYTLEVTAPNGCSASQSASVQLDTELPTNILSIGDADCNMQSITIRSESDMDDELSYRWTGPNGYVSTDMNAEVVTSGNYSLSITASNGCISEANIDVIIDFEYTSTIITTPASGSDGGTAELIIEGGTEPFSISWDNGTTGFTSDNLSVGEHTVTIQDGYGCITTEVFEISTSVNVYDLDLASKIKIYPNPTREVLNILIDDNRADDIYEVLLYDIRGSIIYRSKFEKGSSVDISHIPTGLYILHLNFGNSYYRQKIIKE